MINYRYQVIDNKKYPLICNDMSTIMVVYNANFRCQYAQYYGFYKSQLANISFRLPSIDANHQCTILSYLGKLERDRYQYSEACKKICLGYQNEK